MVVVGVGQLLEARCCWGGCVGQGVGAWRLQGLFIHADPRKSPAIENLPP